MTLEQTYQLFLLFEENEETLNDAKNRQPISGFDQTTISEAVRIFCDQDLKSQFLLTYFWSEDSL